MIYCNLIDPADNLRSVFTSIKTQSEQACIKITTNKYIMDQILTNGLVSIYGDSQGSLIGR